MKKKKLLIDGMLVDSNVPSPASVEGEEAGQFGSTLLPVDTKPPAKRKIKAKTVHIQNMDVPYKVGIGVDCSYLSTFKFLFH